MDYTMWLPFSWAWRAASLCTKSRSNESENDSWQLANSRNRRTRQEDPTGGPERL